MGLKKKEERALYKNRISILRREEGEKKKAKKKTRSWRGGGERVVRTPFHGRHFPDLPGGNVGIKSTLASKKI
jgi:hypothetical protein